MSCNTCALKFSLFRTEKGCPSCGFSYCSKCLKNKVFLKKLNSEVMVCVKCKQLSNFNKTTKVEPPDAYYKRIGVLESATDHDRSVSQNPVEDEISDRLKKLKEDKQDKVVKTCNDDIADRLQKLKGEKPSTSDAELIERLANIKGVPSSALQSKQVVSSINANKTEQEQVEDLMRQYMDQGNIDKKYEVEFDGLVNNLEARLQKLKGSQSSEHNEVSSKASHATEDEEETIQKILTKITAEAKLEKHVLDKESVMDELPFCEICNEDAKMRCLGCKYLFCKHCFKDHEDSDDGCDKFEQYSPPSNAVM
ncbi:abscission/NoCut checkpoint regulator isoform X2 [Pararge aegeria]|uniref:Jg2351 protein n=1 Tax=Pararge aegeria aegeria TaxID=348720 RepID=A0A8S4R6P4_9NEOP|nr:abscission/NoCut checkpoint regulator isoform X2 [Pararge aegeria]CAH2231696.1 jg2351 [Pararge aegeria aegeria]